MKKTVHIWDQEYGIRCIDKLRPQLIKTNKNDCYVWRNLLYVHKWVNWKMLVGFLSRRTFYQFLCFVSAYCETYSVHQRGSIRHAMRSSITSKTTKDKQKRQLQMNFRNWSTDIVMVYASVSYMDRLQVIMCIENYFNTFIKDICLLQATVNLIATTSGVPWEKPFGVQFLPKITKRNKKD